MVVLVHIHFSYILGIAAVFVTDGLYLEIKTTVLLSVTWSFWGMCSCLNYVSIVKVLS